MRYLLFTALLLVPPAALHAADALRAVDADGRELPLVAGNDFLATARPVTQATFVFLGGVYAENRLCTRLADGPAAGEAYVMGYGPAVLAAAEDRTPAVTWPATLAALKALGWEPLSGE